MHIFVSCASERSGCVVKRPRCASWRPGTKRMLEVGDICQEPYRLRLRCRPLCFAWWPLATHQRSIAHCRVSSGKQKFCMVKDVQKILKRCGSLTNILENRKIFQKIKAMRKENVCNTGKYIYSQVGCKMRRICHNIR